jgi:hypothetical protein
MIAIMVFGLTGVSISRYAFAHYLSVTQTSVASNATHHSLLLTPVMKLVLMIML